MSKIVNWQLIKTTNPNIEIIILHAEATQAALVGSVKEKLNGSMSEQHRMLRSSESRTIPEIKKRWSDIKVDTNKCVAACWQSEGATGGVQGTVKLTPLDDCLASIIGNCLVSGVVPQREVDTDLAMGEAAVGNSPLSCARRAF